MESSEEPAEEVPVPTLDNPFRDVTYLCTVLGFGADTVRKWLRNGDIKSYMIGGERRVLESDLRIFVNKRHG